MAEQVRSAVSHADWVAREWKSLRRTKLEELVEVAQSLETWLDEQRSAWLFPGDATRGGPTPMDRVSMLTALYFPELEHVSASIERSGRGAYAWIVNTAVRGMQIADVQARGNYYEQASGEWVPLYNEVRAAITRTRAEASGLMRGTRDV